jgi:DNA modification methylase
MDQIVEEIEFYEQRLKEAEAKLYEGLHKKRKSIPKVIDQQITDKWSAYHGDCIEVMKGIPSNSIHYSIFSPPFSSLFTYSASIRDLGNSTDKEFYDHFSFLIPELYRVIMPGRLVSFHCSDIPAMKERDGYIGLKDFPGISLKKFEDAGFIYHSKCLIWKDPLVEAVRTKAIGLAHKQIIKDSAMCRNGSADYILTVRKPGDNPEPIVHNNGFEYYIGEREKPRAKKNSIQKINKFSHFIWQRYASPVWFDIRQGNTLNVKQARDKDDERHICPLQLDAIARCLELWTNPNDIVLTPFGGIGSEAYQAVLMGRRAILIELKKSYYDLSIKYLKQADKSGQPKGFNLA